MSDLSPLAQRLKNFIEREQLFAPGDRLLLAISGGIDSTVLLHLLLELNYQPELAHFNYKLRGEASEKDAEFVADLAIKNGLKFHLKTEDTKALLAAQKSPNFKGKKESLQMMARRLRAKWFHKLMVTTEIRHILTAHHIDDSIETFLINFLRGTGLGGLLGISSKQVFYRRPLLEISRQDIQKYAQQQGISWREDASNSTNDYTRNRLRNRVLPELKAIQPGLEKRSADNFRQLKGTFDIFIQGLQRMLADIRTYNDKGWAVYDREKLAQWSYDVQLTIMHHSGLADFFNTEQFRQLLEAKRDVFLITEKYYALSTEKFIYTASIPTINKIEITADFKIKKIAHQLQISYKKTARPSNLKCPTNQAYFSTEILNKKLSLRRYKEGDKFQPFGMDGKHQKLQDFFVNQGINQLERKLAWLLVNEAGEILWVVGYRTSMAGLPQEEEQEVLLFSVEALDMSAILADRG